MPYTVLLNGIEKGTFQDFTAAYKTAVTNDMIIADEKNLWHVMMLPYALQQINTINPLRIAYTPERDVYISRH